VTNCRIGTMAIGTPGDRIVPNGKVLSIFLLSFLLESCKQRRDDRDRLLANEIIADVLSRTVVLSASSAAEPRVERGKHGRDDQCYDMYRRIHTLKCDGPLGSLILWSLWVRVDYETNSSLVICIVGLLVIFQNTVAFPIINCTSV